MNGPVTSHCPRPVSDLQAMVTVKFFFPIQVQSSPGAGWRPPRQGFPFCARARRGGAASGFKLPRRLQGDSVPLLSHESVPPAPRRHPGESRSKALRLIAAQAECHGWHPGFMNLNLNICDHASDRHAGGPSHRDGETRIMPVPVTRIPYRAPADPAQWLFKLTRRRTRTRLRLTDTARAAARRQLPP